MKKKILINITESENKLLVEKSEKSGLAKSEIIRRAIDNYFKEELQNDKNI